MVLSVNGEVPDEYGVFAYPGPSGDRLRQRATNKGIPRVTSNTVALVQSVYRAVRAMHVLCFAALIGCLQKRKATPERSAWPGIESSSEALSGLASLWWLLPDPLPRSARSGASLVPGQFRLGHFIALSQLRFAILECAARGAV